MERLQAEYDKMVTQIEEISKTRVRVFLDDASAFVVYRGELHSFHIREGEELSQESYRSIMEEVLPRRSFAP